MAPTQSVTNPIIVSSSDESTNPNEVAASSEGSKRQVVELFELQRRYTLFHNTWEAPFLPHDGVKQWRWLDKNYKKHSWTTGSMESCQAAQQPPIKLPHGFKPVEEAWSIIRSDHCDAEGWEYAVDFYGKGYGEESWWTAKPQVCHCRRRLWKRTFELNPERMLPSEAISEDNNQQNEVVEEDEVENMTEVVDAHIPNFDLEKEAKLLMSEDWTLGNFFLDSMTASGATDISVAPTSSGDQTRRGNSETLVKRLARRRLTARLVVPPAPGAPKTTRATNSLRMEMQEVHGSCRKMTLHIELEMHDTPYCDHFLVFEKWVLEPHSAGGLRLRKSFAMRFTKRTLVRAMIERGTLSAQKYSGEQLVNFLKQRGSSSNSKIEEEPEVDEVKLAEVLNLEVPGLDVTKEANLLLDDDWSRGNLLVDHLYFQEATEVQVAPLAGTVEEPLGAPATPGKKRSHRQLSARMLVPPNPMAPKTTRATITYNIITCPLEDGSDKVGRLIIKTDLVFHDTPYCDCFHVREQLTLEALPDGSGTSVKKGFALIFCKRTMMKGVIESSSLQSQKAAATGFEDFLKSRGKGLPTLSRKILSDGSTASPNDSDANSAKSSKRSGPPTLPSLLGSRTLSTKSLGSPRSGIVVEVWELQRRLTLFHTKWQAPFLPHDGEKSWRWVDKDYRRHEWLSGPWAQVVESDEPPLKVPKSFQAEGDWEVVKTEGSDADGWMYGVDLYQKDDMWYSHPTWFHCRRRLWRIVVEDLDGQSPLTRSITGPLLSPINAKGSISLCRALLMFFALVLLLAVAFGSGWYFRDMSAQKAIGLTSAATCASSSSDLLAPDGTYAPSTL